jgi:hypothetical protein
MGVFYHRIVWSITIIGVTCRETRSMSNNQSKATKKYSTKAIKPLTTGPDSMIYNENEITTAILVTSQTLKDK